MKKKFTFGFLVSVGVLVTVFFGITQKVYPVATVNDVFIPARLFQLTTLAAQNYYSKLGSAYGLTSSTDAQFGSEMRQIALQTLVEDSLVTGELKTIFEAVPLEAAIAQRTAEALASSTTATNQAISELFGLSVDEFKEIVLAPRARGELLQGEFQKSGVDFDAWLQTVLMKAQVSISSNDLVWLNGHVELSGEQPYTAKVKEIFEQVAGSAASLVASSTLSSSSEQQ